VHNAGKMKLGRNHIPANTQRCEHRARNTGKATLLDF
jgi:hypothetical protein